MTEAGPFVLKRVRALTEDERQALTDILRNEVEQLQGLMEVAPESKWPLSTLANTLTRLIMVSDEDEREGFRKELEQTLTSLEDMDPQRSGYYAALRRQHLSGR